MILNNANCNAAIEFEKKMQEWENFRANQISKSKKISVTTIVTLGRDDKIKGEVHALQYQISIYTSLQKFLENYNQDQKNLIKIQFGEAIFHFSSQLETLKQYL